MTNGQILQAPTTFFQRLKYLGPSLIVTANIVGAGELIMTTTLGATAGFVALWMIIASCLVKVLIQLEFGKHAINTGETSMEAFTSLPGPTIGRGHWTIWSWLLIKVFHMMQMGGIAGGVALALNLVFPGIPVWGWACIVGIITVFLVLDGKYNRVEKFSVFLIAGFSLFSVLCVFLLQGTTYAISWAEISSGFGFELPAAMIGVALGAFGITGISAEEILSYPYWCIEKGYATNTGARADTDEWASNAKGWIKVMYLDALLSMVIYTITTVAFYLLGAAILHKIGEVPEGYQTISTLAQIYTESVGPWAKNLFLFGAIMVLFSSFFIGVASNQRMFVDAFAQLKFLDYRNLTQRQKWFKWTAVIIPLGWVCLFLFFKSPVFMVMFGGIALSIMLLMVVYAAFYFRYKRLDKRLIPSKGYDLLLWVSGVLIFAFGIYSVFKVF